MPVKSPRASRQHHVGHKKERRTKQFLKVYAPYIPLLVIVSTGIIAASHSNAAHFPGQVKSYATNVSDAGLLEETNKRRAGEGLQPLTLNTKLDHAAQLKAQDMKDKNYWAHTAPNGREPWDFIVDQQYSYKKAAENLAFGFDNSRSTLNGWMNSPGHRANVMDPDLKEVGFGIMNASNYQSKGEETIVVAMYGTPADGITEPAVQPTQTQPSPTNSAPQQAKQISYIQSLTNGTAPWIGFAIGIIMGTIATYLTVKHMRGIRRAFATSEQFVIHHPLFDTTLIALLVLLLIISQTVGSIY